MKPTSNKEIDMEDKTLVSLRAYADDDKSLEESRRMPSELQALLSEQFIREMEASYQYLAISSYFEAIGLGGFANWMRKQSDEERDHAMKFFDFSHDRGCEIEFAPLSQPSPKFSSPEDALKLALAQEQMNTLAIKKLYGTALQLGEFEMTEFLNWFLKEQIEEEKSVEQVLMDTKRASTDSAALLFLDRELQKR